MAAVPEAILLRLSPFSETSLVAVSFSRDAGRIEALARGCRRPKSPMRGQFDLYAVVEMQVLERRGSLDLITEASIVEEFPSLRTQPAAFAVASVLGQMVLDGCMVRDPHPRSFHVLRKAFRQLDGGVDAGEAALAGLLGLLEDFGVLPRVDLCARCGGGLPEREPLRLSARDGGMLCSACGDGAAPDALPAGALLPLRFLARRGDASAAVRLRPRMRIGLLAGLLSYTEHCLEKPLRGRPFLLKCLSSRRRALAKAAPRSR